MIGNGSVNKKENALSMVNQAWPGVTVRARWKTGENGVEIDATLMKKQAAGGGDGLRRCC